MFANYVGTFGVAAVQLLSIPLFISLLGAHKWGLLSAILALAGALMVLEAGIGLAVSRHFSPLHSGARDSLGSFERLELGYLSASAAIVACGMALALPLQVWLRLDAERVNAGTIALTFLMAGAQIAGGLYRSVLVGTGRQVALNAIVLGFTAARYASAIAAAGIGGSLTMIVGCLAVGSLVETLVRRAAANRALVSGVDVDDRIDAQLVSSASGAWSLSVAGAVGALGTQIDRLLLSRVVDPVQLGAYSIAATLSLAALQLFYPLTTSLIPKLQQFRKQGGVGGAYSRTYAILVALLGALWIAASLVVAPGLGWWLPDDELAREVLPLFWLHLCGTSLNALCVPLYLGLLANHRDVTIACTASASLTIQLIVLFVGMRYAGVSAGAWAWCAANATLLVVYALLSRRMRHEK